MINLPNGLQLLNLASAQDKLNFKILKQAATLIRPSLTSEAAVNAIEELELMALNAQTAARAKLEKRS